MRPFGYANRNWAMMHTINNTALRQYWLNEQERTPETAEMLDDEQREINSNRGPAMELTSWYQERHQALHPDEPTLASVRFLAVWYPVGSEIATPDGHWQRRAIDDISRERVLVIFQRSFRES